MGKLQTAMGRMYGVSSGVLFVIIGVMFVTIIYGIIKMIKVQGQ